MKGGERTSGTALEDLKNEKSETKRGQKITSDGMNSKSRLQINGISICGRARGSP